MSEEILKEEAVPYKLRSHSEKETSSYLTSLSAINNSSDISSTISTKGPPSTSIVTSNSSKLRCFTRTRIIISSVIILSIVIIVILVAALSARLTLPSMKSKTNPSTISADINASSNTTVGSSSPIIYDVGNGGISGDPPCSSYTVINDPSRNIARSGMGGACDDGPFFNTSIAGRWIRFLGTGGTTIPLSSPGMMHCSAFLAGWYNGTLPLIVGEIVNGTVCFETNAAKGEPMLSASVINCDSFYVYFLPPVILCNARYCTV